MAIWLVVASSSNMIGMIGILCLTHWDTKNLKLHELYNSLTTPFDIKFWSFLYA